MKDILTSPRIESMKRKRKAFRLRLSILFLILFISIVWALAFFSNNSYVTVNEVVVTGTRIINASDVEFSVEDSLSGKYLRLFAKKNVFIYPQNQIYKKLLADFPRIEKLKVQREGLNTLKVDIVERAGSYLYCGTTIPELQTQIGENCYFINNDGYIFDKAPYFSGNVYFKYYSALVDGDVDPLGKQMLTPEHFHATARFVDGVIKLGFKPTHLVIGADSSTLYLDHGISDTKPQIIWKGENDLDSILDNLSVSMAKPEFANEIRSKYTTLLYIDLRFKNKVLYKFE